MQTKHLGNTDLLVSQLCLGSMTWGTQNNAQEAFDQIDCSIQAGINFIDTAELYPTTPVSAKTQGRTEEIIGEWFAYSGKRDQIILATKVAGNGPKHIDSGRDIDGAKIRRSLEGSLKRLQTDYVDLYQLHWPNRGSYHFRQSWKFNPTNQNREAFIAHIHDVLETAQDLITEGKIRHIGLSNESCWGTSQFINIADQYNLPRVVSVQNEYSLMHRIFDLDFAELAHNEQVGLLAFSPLACGMLTGKYDNDAIPEGSRRSLAKDLTGRFTDRSKPPLAKYIALAREHNLHPAQMALAFCMTRPFMTSVILGATSVEQLQTNLSAANTTLSPELLDSIAAIHRDYPIPM
jgi:aryl-alcohol dehydrogenase-like predicted oxidoreductase